MNPKVDAYLSRAQKWQEEMTQLRAIVLDCHLTEELKWGKPCYTFQGANVVIIVPFKETCALLFAKGALLKDPQGLLIKPTENTQAARQLRFASVRERSGVRVFCSGAIRHPAQERSLCNGSSGFRVQSSEFAV